MTTRAHGYHGVAIDGGLFPTNAQMLLLQAALHQTADAQQAFFRWADTVDLNAEFGWEALRLMPLVYHNLAAMDTEHPMMGRLKGVYRRSWYQAHTLFRRSGPAVEALSRDGISVLLSKGAPLAQEYYRNLALRPMTDIDVCVRPDDVRRTVALLASLQWVSTSELSGDFLRYRHALQFRHAEGGEIDLHWNLLPEAMDPQLNALFWDSAEPLKFQGTNVLQLSPTTLMLQQVVHGIRWNEETPVRWIVDAIMISRARGTEIDWDQIDHAAQGLRVSSRLALGLSFLVENFSFQMPPAVLRRLVRRRTTIVERLENHVVLQSDSALGTGVRAEFIRGIVEYTRIVDPARHPVRVIVEYPQFLRLKWQLKSRRSIVPFIARGVMRRLMKRLHGTTLPLSPPQNAIPPVDHAITPND